MNDENNNGMLDFDAEAYKPWSRLTRYQGKMYLLRQASGEAAVAYRAELSRGVTVTESGDNFSRTLGNMANAEPVLVQKCTFELIEDEKGRPVEYVDADGKTATLKGLWREGPVTMGWVKALPNPIMKRMTDEIISHSDLLPGAKPSENGKAGEEMAKNSQEPSTVGSAPEPR